MNFLASFMLGAVLLGDLSATVTAHLADGTRREASLIAVDEREITLQVEGKNQVVPRKNLLLIESSQPVVDQPTATTILLRGQGIVRVDQITSDDRTFRIELPNARTFEFPINQLVGIVWEESDRADLAARYRRLANPSPRDRIVAVRGNQRATLEGIVGPIKSDTVSFTLDQETIEVKRDRLREIAFAMTTADMKPAILLTDRAGNTWPADDVSLSAEQLVAVHASLGRLEWPAREITRIDFSISRITYLSDLDPILVEQTPYFDRVHAFRRDENLAGEPLALRNSSANPESYSKGLALHSKTALTYTLPPGEIRLAFDVGIDPSAGAAGAAEVSFAAGGMNLWKKVISADQPLTSVELPIPNLRPGDSAKRLVILVDFGPRGDVGDHVILGNARLIQ
jgi:hypothetical protein